MTVLAVDNLTYYYPETSTPALRRVTLAIGEGECVLITGPSGGGKTTLARALSGLLPNFFGGRIGGGVRHRGLPIGTLPRVQLHAEIGIVLQDPERQILMTVVEGELALGLENMGLPPGLIGRRVAETASSLGLGGYLPFRTDELSGGLAQRTVIAAILAMGPRVLILDEPTAQLDRPAALNLMGLLKQLHRERGYTILIIEHRMEQCLPLAGRILFIREGGVQFDGTPDSFRRWAATSAPHFAPSPPSATRVAGVVPPPAGIAREEPVVTVSNLSFTYRNGVQALRGIDCSVRRGEIVAVLGDNGAGKSTLLKIICGLLTPASGTALLMERPPADYRNSEKASLCGYLSQNPGDLLFHDTVSEEVGYTLRATGAPENGAVERALARWGITHLARRNPRELSAGERQCVALAATTIAAPPLLLLDEPTRGQDPLIREHLGKALVALAHECGTAVIFVTQDFEFASNWSRRAVVMSGGAIVADGPTHETISRPARGCP